MVAVVGPFLFLTISRVYGLPGDFLSLALRSQLAIPARAARNALRDNASRRGATSCTRNVSQSHGLIAILVSLALYSQLTGPAHATIKHSQNLRSLYETTLPAAAR